MMFPVLLAARVSILLAHLAENCWGQVQDVSLRDGDVSRVFMAVQGAPASVQSVLGCGGCGWLFGLGIWSMLALTLP